MASERKSSQVVLFAMFHFQDYSLQCRIVQFFQEEQYEKLRGHAWLWSLIRLQRRTLSFVRT